MRLLLKIFKGLAIGLVAIVLVTVGIDAADHYDNLSETIIGRILFSAEEDGPCPAEMVYIATDKDSFCIDKYEVSPGQSCPHQNVGNQENTRDNLNTYDCLPVPAAGAMPWRFVSQSQAITACAKAGKRLPTDEEWYLGSLGTPDKANDWFTDDCQVNNNWDNQPGFTGSGETCLSAAGAYDMIGNVWEWVKGEIRDGKYNGEALPLPGYITGVDIQGKPITTDEHRTDPNFNEDYFWIKDTGVRGMARGGYWNNAADAGLYSMYLVSPPSFAGAGIGFRCVK